MKSKTKSKTRKNNKKISKKQTGGHVFYYDVLPEICGLDIHEEDCVPSTLYFLGVLTYEAAAHLATQRRYGLDYRTILVWLDENFPDEPEHVFESLVDLRDYYIGERAYDADALNEYNDEFMAKLNIILPYQQMGVLSYFVSYDEEDLEESTGGHVFCIIKNEYEQLVIIDPQQKLYVIINTVHDAARYIGMGGGLEFGVYIQQDIADGLNQNSPELVRGPNNYILPDPNAFNATRMLNINRDHKAETAEYYGEEPNNDEAINDEENWNNEL
jgi:hypothetical protein